MTKQTQAWPADIPLTEEQSSQLIALASILTPEQGLWVSGYLAGLTAGQRQISGSSALNVSSVAAADQQARLTILYASETGNARSLAMSAGEIAGEMGLNYRVIDVADFKTRTLSEESHLLIITSTHGEGEPPEPAFAFNEFLFGRKAPKLARAKFAVLGLGDTSYEHFCKTARTFDEKFAELGAERVHPRIELDVDYGSLADAWLREALAAFGKDTALTQSSQSQSRQPTAAVAAVPSTSLTPAPQAYHQAAPFSATVIDHIQLNGRGSSKATYHIELSLEDSGLSFAPGDALGVIATNAAETVDDVLEALQITGEERIEGPSGAVPLRAALTHDFELTLPTPRFLSAYAKLSGSEQLQRLASLEDRSVQFDYLRQRQIVDIISEYPARGISGQELAGALRRLEPRLYSLASSQALLPDEAHLTVAAVRFQGFGRERFGVTSGMLGRLTPEDRVPVYISPNDAFRLPETTDAPIIMVGAGTGVAPFRAFIQEREALDIKSPSWLIFGDRNFRTDFLYQTDWQQFRKDGYLTRMDIAFSRDGGSKIYVQNRMLEQARDLFDWLERGAYFYVCGDASAMAPDVHEALIQVVATGGGKSREDAEEYVSKMREEKRYRRDVY